MTEDPGMPVITMPLSEFEDLRKKADQLDRLFRVAKPPKRKRGRPSAVARDPEVAEYIRSFPAHAYQTEIRAACIEKFGVERTPSLSALNRFLLRAIADRK